MTLDIVIPCYNCGNTIKHVISKLLKQKLAEEWNIKFILVNDCSTDGTSKILAQLKSAKIKVIQTPRNSGRAFSRNFGANFSDSEYILFLDSDCMPKNEHTLNLLLNKINLTHDIVFGSLFANGKHFWAKYFNFINKSRENNIHNNKFYNLTSAYFLISRALFKISGGFNENYRKYGFEDRDFFIRLIKFKPTVGYSPESIVLHDVKDDIYSLKNKLIESGQYSSILFSRTHPEIYKDMAYSKIDSKLHPFAIRPFIFIALPLKNIAFKVCDILLNLKLIPFPIKVMIARFACGFAYSIGTYFSSSEAF